MEDAELLSIFSEKKLDKLELDEPVENQEYRRRYKYDFTLINYENFSKAVLEKVFLPKTIRVYSEFELNYSFAEIAVQAQIIKLLPESLNMDLFTKRKGMPSVLSFDLSLYGKEYNQSVHLRRIGNLKKPDMVIDFEFKDIVHSICFMPFNEDELESYGFDHSNFKIPPGSIENVLLPFLDYFPNQLGLKCFKVELCFIDTVYKDPINFELGSNGGTSITAYASFHLEHHYLSLIALDNKHSPQFSKVDRQIKDAVNELSMLPPFQIFFGHALNKVSSRFDQFMLENPKHKLTLDDFQDLATYFTNTA